MESSAGVALEEITWRSPQHVQMMGGFIHSNNILFYFAESPFFDPTSNNASLTLQAMHNENLRPFIETREAFEGRLKSMQGLEFMVARDPIQEAAAAVSAGEQSKEPSNIWVVRKQNRIKRDGMVDQVHILATYFIVGDFVYMAPSVLSVVGRRMLSTVTSLAKVLPAASKQLLFSPSHGHTYTPSVPKYLEGVQSAQQSKATTPAPSAKPTPAPTKTSLPTSTPPLSPSGMQDLRNLTDALDLLSRYGDEYVDEVSLVGEPGNFIFSKTTAAAGGGELLAPNAAQARQVPTRAPDTPASKVGTPGTPAALSTGTPGPSDVLEKGRTVQLARDKGKKKAR